MEAGALSAADAIQLKAELEQMRANLTTATSLSMARDTEMKLILEAKATQDLAAKAQEHKEVELRGQLSTINSRLETIAKDNDSLRVKVASTQLAQPAF